MNIIVVFALLLQVALVYFHFGKRKSIVHGTKTTKNENKTVSKYASQNYPSEHEILLTNSVALICTLYIITFHYASSTKASFSNKKANIFKIFVN